jgi:glycosyltransferase involved in cell wall biosynthesis
LNAIVKNESHVIRRCLASVKPWIDSWVIVDTGSTDGTQGLVRTALEGIPGKLLQSAWADFGTNRTEAIKFAKGLSPDSDYLLFIDADEQLQVPPGFKWPALTADVYRITMRYGNLSYARDALVKVSLPWHYVGVLHEYLDCPEPHHRETLDGPTILVTPDGARSKDPDKFKKDAAVLEAALKADPGNSRYVFYLAQSYRDAGEPLRAVIKYQQRAEMGGWDQEVYYSLLQIAQATGNAGVSVEKVVMAYLGAYRFRPYRPETLGRLAMFCRERKEFVLARLFAGAAIKIPQTDDILFVEPEWADWRNLDEFAVACYWTGDYLDSASACQDLLSNHKLPEHERARVTANLNFAQEKLC